MKKTKENIYVAKEVFVSDNNTVESPFMDFKWEFNKIYEVSLKEIKKNIKMSVFSEYQEWFNGFHSHRVRPPYPSSFIYNNGKGKIERILVYKAVIPKGSYIVYGMGGDILSNKLMLLNEKL